MKIQNILCETSNSLFTDIPDLYDSNDMLERIQIFVEYEPSLKNEYEELVKKLTIGARYGKHEKIYVHLWYDILKKAIPLFLDKYHPDANNKAVTNTIIDYIADELTVGYMRDIKDDIRHENLQKRKGLR